MIQVQQFHITNIPCVGACSLSNPFSAELKGVFHGPADTIIVVPGYYDGKQWNVRFSPPSVGRWEYWISSPHIFSADIRGTIDCTVNTNPLIHGAVRVDPDYPHHFIFEDGSRQYIMAYEADWLWAPDYGKKTLEVADKLLGSIEKYGFNQILMNTFAQDTSWCPGKTCDFDYGPPPAFLWEGTNEDPDHTRMNSAFFDHFDRLMDMLLERGFTVHIFLRVYNKMVNWPKNYTSEDDLYFRYFISRYQAYPNVIWDFAKEAKNEPDKRYIADRIHMIRALDGYRHLVTVHDDHVYFDRDEWRNTIDFLTGQQHEEFFMYGLYERTRKKWPIFNSEISYEHGPGGPEDKSFASAQSPEECIHWAWETAMSGSYVAYYYTWTAWDVIDLSYLPPGYAYHKILFNFFSSIEWWRFEPYRAFQREHGRGMRIPGEQYVIYGTYKEPQNHAYIEFERPEEAISTWINVYTGEMESSREGLIHLDGARYKMRSPFPDGIPWVCYIRQS